jgi:hypothetical protein
MGRPGRGWAYSRGRHIGGSGSISSGRLIRVAFSLVIVVRLSAAAIVGGLIVIVNLMNRRLPTIDLAELAANIGILYPVPSVLRRDNLTYHRNPGCILHISRVYLLKA